MFIVCNLFKPKPLTGVYLLLQFSWFLVLFLQRKINPQKLLATQQKPEEFWTQICARFIKINDCLKEHFIMIMLYVRLPLGKKHIDVSYLFVPIPFERG